jgi:hypothetical protein
MAVAHDIVGGPGAARGPAGVLGRVLELRYGLGGGLPQTVQQTARALRIHPDFIRSMEAVALCALPPDLRARLQAGGAP